MAVVDLNTFDDRTKGMKVGGTDALFFRGVAAITSGDSIASVYRFAKVPLNAVPFSGEIFSSANITNVNDADIGFYKDAEFGGGVLDKDILADGISLATAKPRSAAGLFGLAALTVADSGKTVGELLGLGSYEYQTVDLALTINVAAGATGTVSFDFIFLSRA